MRNAARLVLARSFGQCLRSSLGGGGEGYRGGRGQSWLVWRGPGRGEGEKRKRRERFIGSPSFLAALTCSPLSVMGPIFAGLPWPKLLTLVLTTQVPI